MTKFTKMIVFNLVKSKAAAKNELFFNKPTSGARGGFVEQNLSLT